MMVDEVLAQQVEGVGGRVVRTSAVRDPARRSRPTRPLASGRDLIPMNRARRARSRSSSRSLSVCTSVRISNSSSSVPKPPGKDHERLREIREPELAHEEVVELEVQAVGDVRVRALLEGQPDVQADRLAAGFARAAVGRLHDSRAAARRDDEAVVVSTGSVRLHDVSRRASSRALFVVARPFDRLPGSRQARPDSARRRFRRRAREASRSARVGALAAVARAPSRRTRPCPECCCSLKRRSGSRYSARIRIGRASALSRNSGYRYASGCCDILRPLYQML